MIESVLAVLILLFSVALMLATLWSGWFYASRLHFAPRITIATVFFFALYKVIMYYLLPLVLRLFSNFQFVYIDGYTPAQLALLYLIEAVSWVPWLFGFILVGSLKRRKHSNKDLISPPPKTDKISKFLIIFLAVFSIPFKIYEGVSLVDLDYQLPVYLQIFKPLFYYGGGPASVLLLLVGYKRWGGGYTLLGLGGVFFTLATSATRGTFVYMFVLMLFVGYYLAANKRRYLMRAATIFISLAALFISVGGLPRVAMSNDASGLGLSFDFSTDKKGDRTPLEEIEWRFGAASRMSIAFIKMYERGDSAGINPIKHSLLGFLPRSLNPDKPIPSTVDPNDIYSQGMYLIYSETHGPDHLSMTEFSSGGYAYWVFGLLGVLILPFISGVYIGLCSYYFRFYGIASVALMMIVFKPFGYVDPKIWVSDIIMQIYQIIIPLAALTFALTLIAKLKFTSARGRLPSSMA